MPENYITKQNETGNVHIAEDVLYVMASASVAEVDGVAGLSNTFGSDLVELLGRKSLSRGIKVTVEEDTITIDALITVRYGYVVTDVAKKVQEEIASSVESMTGMKPVVNVHVTGIAFDKASNN
ncbi:MAG: Asp23/Gls24 family envelope stress response protein [Eubacteriales bacterium]|nr:Asp23/Gls24 family envelope stress response protein [Eubacteriales bacterium]